ncbi:Competence protein ComM [Lacunisphaera limnophila]|uniref:Competence protein ComM n=1 Tax=Lacunisphaera limnophila TaxID=1838286 RepID=A0A1D8AYY7_9BACT|nr:YifB family Mg chelatase-like AAA ATPase [Lacunisphaera limnophila]AOS46074.1 Competence protein ComM [Lacunisphaera limnophila]
MLATIGSAALLGIDAVPVQIEVNTGESGIPDLILVGLPDTAVKESQDRVFSALSNSALKMPPTRTTINLAPGDLRKEGAIYDLPIALGILVATGQLACDRLHHYLIAGELSLSGATRPIKGGLAMAVLARAAGRRAILLPPVAAQEAALVEGLEVYEITSLAQAARYLGGQIPLSPVTPPRRAAVAPRSEHEPDFAEIKGQHAVRRAVEIAVSGGHNLLMIGPPGSGKSMIARRIPGIMPTPSLEEYLEILRIHSAAGHTMQGEVPYLQRPARAPHHTISDVGLIGGGTLPGPGEISLAHHGVLFLDELPEFRRSALEVLRQPLEDGQVTISRSAGKVTLPCRFMLVAAMNPCPCGYLGDPRHECRCAPAQIQRYRARISGPLLDRIDLHVEAPALSITELRADAGGEASALMRERVETARQLQYIRYRGTGLACNARMPPSQLKKFCALDSTLGDLLQQAMEQLSLSARAYDRILKVARTIADLAESESIRSPHLLEAIQYRSLDRNVFY